MTVQIKEVFLHENKGGRGSESRFFALRNKGPLEVLVVGCCSLEEI